MRLGKFFDWYHIFHKRFLKKTGFLILLALIPVAALLLGLISDMDSGILTVYLAAEDEDPLSASVMESLMENDGIIRFVSSDVTEAKNAVVHGKADAAWVFRAGLSERVKSFAQRQTANNFLVSVYQREDDVTMMLMREKLSGALYPYVAHEFYIDYVENEVSPEIDSETLEEYYAAVMPEGSELFEVAETGVLSGGSDYLSAPLRGLLAVLCVLCGMAVSMFFKSDEKRELFIRIPERQIPIFRFAYHFMAVFDMCIVMMASLYIAGLGGDLAREAIDMLLFCFATVLFCLVLERICKGIGALSALAPLLAIGMLVICPVFWNVKTLSPLARLFPPYYYLNGSALDMLLYIAAGAAVYILLCMILPARRNES